jgi:uncharacterized protein YecT (DUF1311 family)
VTALRQAAHARMRAMSAQASTSAFVVLVAALTSLGAGVHAATQRADVDCGAAATPAERRHCAYEEFLAADRVYAQRYGALQVDLSRAQRDRLRQMQQAWIAYRTAACRFETDPDRVGPARSQLYWRCATRMTLDRAEALDRLARCVEGDAGCSPPSQ